LEELLSGYVCFLGGITELMEVSAIASRNQ